MVWFIGNTSQVVETFYRVSGCYALSYFLPRGYFKIIRPTCYRRDVTSTWHSTNNATLRSHRLQISGLARNNRQIYPPQSKSLRLQVTGNCRPIYLPNNQASLSLGHSNIRLGLASF